VPSLDDAMPFQYCELALDVQFAPESEDVQMFPALPDVPRIVS